MGGIIGCIVCGFSENTSRLFCLQFYFLNSLRESPYRSGGMVPDANIMYPFSFSNLCIYATRQALGPTFEYFINF